MMSLLKDLKILYHLAASPIRGKTHRERLESFYAGQADGYDDFRKRLLRGREELYRAVPIGKDAVWIDMGGGTGSNLEYIADRIPRLKKAYVVDLSGSLLKVARDRIDNHGWDNVEAVEEDVTTFVPAEGSADIITFSYSLTMIPDWFAAIDHATKLLKPGGVLGVVDFYVSRKYPAENRRKHGLFQRTFWPDWFANDNVFLSRDHLPYLERNFKTIKLQERTAPVPYLSLLGQVPYYRYLGRKP